MDFDLWPWTIRYAIAGAVGTRAYAIEVAQRRWMRSVVRRVLPKDLFPRHRHRWFEWVDDEQARWGNCVRAGCIAVRAIR